MFVKYLKSKLLKSVKDEDSHVLQANNSIPRCVVAERNFHTYARIQVRGCSS